MKSLVREMIDVTTVVSGNADSGTGGMDRRVGRVARLQVAVGAEHTWDVMNEIWLLQDEK